MITLSVISALCIYLHTNVEYEGHTVAQVTALDPLIKALKVTDASVSMHVQPMIILNEWNDNL